MRLRKGKVFAYDHIDVLWPNRPSEPHPPNPSQNSTIVFGMFLERHHLFLNLILNRAQRNTLGLIASTLV